MLSILVLLVAIGSLEARPSQFAPSFSFSAIIDGEDASPGEFPWQLSQQRLGGSWSHSCGASLLSSNRALSAAHCVNGASASILRVVAGLHRRSDMTGTQISNVVNYVMHEDYNTGLASAANDIAILHLETPITTTSNIQFAILPADNSNNFAGTTCVISGWGRTSASNVLPDVLQKVSMPVITTAQCSAAMQNVAGARVWDNHICIQSTSGTSGSCNGDSGGPMNCPSGGTTVVAGVTSWGVSNIANVCQPSYPSVYTRTSAYLDWIRNH